MLIDFTGCEIDLAAKYGGSDQKRGIIYNGDRYMIKFAERIPSESQNPLNSSYSNSIFSEYICCNILNALGFEAQQTLLGYYKMKPDSESRPVVACRNFLQQNEVLLEFKVIENALADEKPGPIPKIEDIYAIMKSDNVYFDSDFGEQALKSYWDTFILDSLLGNFDRHSNNWGYILNQDTGNLRIAPIYDCGSCLYPKMADHVLQDILSSEDEINLRINVFPKAALIVGEERKISYKEYINSLCNPDCNEAVLRIVPRLDFNIINQVIDDVDELSDIRKQFYKTMLHERYIKIIEPAYEKLLELKERELDNVEQKQNSANENYDVSYDEYDDFDLAD